MIRQVARSVVVCVGLLVLTAALAQAQDSLDAARELYASAEYDSALSMLDRVAMGTPSNQERQSIDLYRSLCQLALGRREDADRSIERIIARNPLYQPDDDLSPRLRSAFSDAKKRLLPGIVQQQYAEAKGAFERQEFQEAAFGFRRVVDALNDPDIGPAAKHPPLSDLRTLAAGFHDLSVKAIPPPPAPEPVAAPPPRVALPPRIYTGDEGNVVPPQIITQDLPRYPTAVPPRGVTGVIEVVINEFGAVESAIMAVPVLPAYDRALLAAAAKWQYVPAMAEGGPVKFRKRIQISVTPPPSR